MKHHKYVIVGDGIAAYSAIQGIRDMDPVGSVAVVRNQLARPCNGPAFLDGLYKGERVESVRSNNAGPGITVHLDRRASAIDRVRKIVVDDKQGEHAYDALLLATGCRTRQLPLDDRDVLYFRTVEDCRRLCAFAQRHRQLVVIGGGFIGAELAAALATSGKKVTMIFPEKSIGAHAFPGTLGVFLNAYFRDRGVNLLCGETVNQVEPAGSHFRVQTGARNTITADAVIAGAGMVPDVALAQAAGLPVDNGIVVDEYLRTADPAIYAAGYVANVYSPSQDTGTRVEHEESALVMGRIGGRNMTGSSELYWHLPCITSSAFDLKYEAVGMLDASLDIVEDWEQQFRKGVVYYLKDDRVRGVLLWNTSGQIDAARRMIESRQSCDAVSLTGRIPTRNAMIG